MLFSIIIPVYNVEKYIRECLDSILNQEFKDYEIILVNDGSTDRSGIICDEYTKKYSCIRVIHKKNEGLLMARRTGLKLAKGDYCMHCDSDDYIEKDTLIRLFSIIQIKRPDMIMFGYNVVDDHHKILEKHHDVFRDMEEFGLENKEIILSKLVSTTWLNNMVTKVTRRECIDIDMDYSEYEEIRMGEDLLQVIPLVQRCSTFVYIAEPFYLYRYNPVGISKNIDKKCIQDKMKVTKRLNRFLEEENVSNQIWIQFYNRYIKTIHKYFFIILKSGITKDNYIDICSSVIKDETYIKALKYKKEWTQENKILCRMLKPFNYYLMRILSRIVLSKEV